MRLNSNSTENTKLMINCSREDPGIIHNVKRDLMKRINGESQEEKYTHYRNKKKRKKKRVLLTAWSAMNDDQ